MGKVERKNVSKLFPLLSSWTLQVYIILLLWSLNSFTLVWCLVRERKMVHRFVWVSFLWGRLRPDYGWFRLQFGTWSERLTTNVTNPAWSLSGSSGGNRIARPRSRRSVDQTFVRTRKFPIGVISARSNSTVRRIQRSPMIPRRENTLQFYSPCE